MNPIATFFTLAGYLITMSLLSFIAIIGSEKMVINDAFVVVFSLIVFNIISFALPLNYFLKYKALYFNSKENKKVLVQVFSIGTNQLLSQLSADEDGIQMTKEALLTKLSSESRTSYDLTLKNTEIKVFTV